PGGRPDMAALERMSAVLAPRGPDGQGRWEEGPIGLTHRRLSIIDLSEGGAQPMVRDDLAIVFNGCIYNHHELREELRAAGHELRTTSDTEVILAAYRHWGPERFLDHLIGMFAFALVERASGRVLLARDRLGIKPLYLAEVDGALRFASTLPALLAGGGIDTTLDRIALQHYMSFHSVVPSPRTILAGVRRLAPATTLTIEPDGTRTERRWWAPPYQRRAEHADWSAADWNEAILDVLRTAVRRRMVADVPVGVLLSGGLDSSMIVAILAEQGQRDLATYSIGFPDANGREGNEFAYSDLMAERFATDHHKIALEEHEVADVLRDAVRSMSEPMVSHDVVAFYLLSREVAKDIKVVQSGQGADEVFAGYSWYPPLRDAPGLGDDAYVAEFVDAAPEQRATELAEAWRVSEDVAATFVTEHFSRPDADTPIDRALRLDTEVMLVDDPVKRVDNMTMAWGLEARVPFLDHELVELAAACPPELKLAHGGKGVLKEAARGLVPDEVIDREKGYFPVPLISQMSGPAHDLVGDVLTRDAARERRLFDPAAVDRMLAAPNAVRTTLDANRLWQVALLELWLAEHGL
ncbi:MAG: asparagine synthase, glutamine-hydrolyzing, partial [Solirubrobacteraceae bacterium]|nr:asparagine synthase, glutamine-hydrolyzing [Solirubrobacteraceae bacterium]